MSASVGQGACPLHLHLPTSSPQPFWQQDRFRGRRFFHGLVGVGVCGAWDGFGIIQTQYIQAYLLLCGPVSNRPGLVPVHGPEVGDPCSPHLTQSCHPWVKKHEMRMYMRMK